MQREHETSRAGATLRTASSRIFNLNVLGGLLLVVLIESPAQAGWFSSRLDDFKDLVKAGKLDDASALVQQYSDYFTKLKDSDRAYVADTLSEPERAALAQALAAIQASDADKAPMRRWASLKTTMQAGRDEIAKARKMPMHNAAVDEGVAALQGSLDQINTKLQDTAGAALKIYGLDSSPAFTSIYPVSFTPETLEKAMLDANILSYAQQANPAHLRKIATLYFKALPKDDGLIKRVSKLYIDRMFRERRAIAWQQKWVIMRDARKMGFDTVDRARNGVLIVTWPDSPGSGVQMTGPTLFPTVQLQPGVSPADFLKNELPSKLSKSPLDVVVFIRPYSMVATRTIQPTQNFTSTYVSGTQQVQNPEYVRLQNEVADARNTLALAQQAADQAQANARSSTFAAITAATAVGVAAAAQVSLQNTQNELARTSPTVTQNIVSNYTYQRTDVKIVKSSIFAFAVYDVGTGTVFSNIGDHNVDYTKNAKYLFANWSTFLINGVKASDPNAASIQSGFTNEANLDSYQAQPLSYNYDAMLPLNLNYGF